jgi:hypothetical protein
MSSMRRFARYTGGVAAAAMLMLLAPLTASAGGPTSVILVSPGRQATASLYTTDEAYGRLQTLLGENPVADPAAPDLTGGPGSDAINVTWLVHDVQIWRVDRVFTDAKGGPWISTIMVPDGNSTFTAGGGVVHRPGDAKELIALLSALRLLGTSPPQAFQGPKAAPVDAAVNQPVTAAPAKPDPTDRTWLWLVIGLAGGATLAVGLRPLVRRLRPN